MIINDLDDYYIVFDTKNRNTELDTLGLRYGWLLYCFGFLFLHKFHHCCISLFRQLDIAIKSLCIFIAVCCDGVIHIGKFCENWDEFVPIFLIIIKARLQGHIYGLI